MPATEKDATSRQGVLDCIVDQIAQDGAEQQAIAHDCSPTGNHVNAYALGQRILLTLPAGLPQILAARKDRESAKTCLRTSIAKAEAQQALSLELRSAMTLARLLREDGECVEARQCVADVYDRFTEGTDALDLKMAHAMISQDV